MNSRHLREFVQMQPKQALGEAKAKADSHIVDAKKQIKNVQALEKK
jgi:hypothetical protein